MTTKAMIVISTEAMPICSEVMDEIAPMITPQGKILGRPIN